MSLLVTVIIPAHNEQEAIGDVVHQLRQLVPGYQILVVDDGSTDATAECAARAGARVISHTTNRGYGAALATGVRDADTDVVVFVDGDGQHNPFDVPRLVAEIADCDMVVGARTANSHTDISRMPGKKLLSIFANYMTKQKIPDVNSGFRAFRRDVLLRYLHLMPQGFSFSTTSTFAMLKGGRRIKWIPIETRKRIGVSTVRQLKHGPQTLMLMLRLTVLFDPLRVFLPVSALMLCSAAVMTILNFIFFRIAVPASAVFLGISSIMVFMMALITDQVSAIRREMHEWSRHPAPPVSRREFEPEKIQSYPRIRKRVVRRKERTPVHL